MPGVALKNVPRGTFLEADAACKNYPALRSYLDPRGRVFIFSPTAFQPGFGKAWFQYALFGFNCVQVGGWPEVVVVEGFAVGSRMCGG